MLLEILKAIRAVLFFPIQVVLDILFAIAIDPIWVFLKKKELKRFLLALGNDEISRKLLEKIKALNIIIDTMALSDQLSGTSMQLHYWHNVWEKKTIPQGFKISSSTIEGFSQGKIGKEKIQLALAHELGHIRQDAIKLTADYGRTCGIGKIDQSCLCEELAASHKGFNIIEEITSKNIGEIFSQDDLSGLIKANVAQCPKCLLALTQSPPKCSLIKGDTNANINGGNTDADFRVCG